MEAKDIKVGSVWVYGIDNNIKIKITDVNPYFITIKFKFIEHPWPPALNDTDICWEPYPFLQWYKPVYTVEGFEI